MDTATPSYVDQITAPNDAALRVTQRTFYDGLGRAVQSRLFHVPLADTTFTTVVEATEYDALGRAVCQLLPVNGGQQTFSAGLVTGCRTNAYPRTVTTYDALGRVAEVTQPDGARTLMQYQGRRTAVLDANNHQRISLADAYGQLIEVREYDAAFTSITWNAAVYATTQYTYDVSGNLTTVMDDADNQATMEYDVLGRKTGMTDPDMGSWAYRYDANGNLIKQRDARNQAMCFYYDSLNRLVGKTYHNIADQPDLDALLCNASSYPVTYTYDAGTYGKGRRTGMSDLSGSSTWTYDPRGRMTQETKTINGGGTFTTQYQYDDLDQVTRIIYPDGEQVTPSYTTAGQPKTLATTLGGSYVTNATYRAPGQISSLALGNGLTTHYTYDSLSARLTRARTGALLDLGYHYDAGGNVSRIQETTATTTQFSDAFTTKNTTAWVWNAYQTVPYADGGNAVVKNTGTGSNWSANFYRAGYALTHGETARMRFKVTDANSQAVFALVSNDAAPRRFGVYAVNGSLQLQYSTDGTNWVYLPLWQILTTNQWYSLELRVDDTSTSGFVAEVCTETLPRACASQHAVMPIGKSWRFQQWVHTGSAYLDDYAEFTGSGDVQTFTYDALDRLMTAQSANGAYLGYSESYQYSPIGNLTYKTGQGTYTYPTSGPNSVRPHAVTSAGGHTYAYDANGNMTTHWYADMSQTLVYSAENRLASVTRNGKTTAYFYDGDGVLVKKTAYENLAAGVPATSDTTLFWPAVVTNGDTWANSGNGNYGEFAYTGSIGLRYVQLDLGGAYTVDQIKVWHYAADSRTYNNTKTQVSADGVTWYTVFDSAVSGTYPETAAGKTHTFTPRTVRYVRDYLNGSSSNFSNHWVELEVWGNRTTVVVNALYEKDVTANLSTKYYYFGSQRIAMRRGSTLTYLHGDHLGSASLTTDASGAKESLMRYMPYGELRVGGLSTDRQFTGQRRESSLGFYDYVARQYDPALGRFLQADTIIPGAASGAGGGAATLGYDSKTRLTPLTVNLGEFVAQINVENREILQFGPFSQWDACTRREHNVPSGPVNPQALNRYAYVLNNPLRYIDPTGHDPTLPPIEEGGNEDIYFRQLRDDSGNPLDSFRLFYYGEETIVQGNAEGLTDFKNYATHHAEAWSDYDSAQSTVLNAGVGLALSIGLGIGGIILTPEPSPAGEFVVIAGVLGSAVAVHALDIAIADVLDARDDILLYSRNAGVAFGRLTQQSQ